MKKQEALKKLLGVDTILSILKKEKEFCDISKNIIVLSAREVLDEFREKILNGQVFEEKKIISTVKKRVKLKLSFKLKKVINATGIVIHTNLGRSVLEESVLKNILKIGGGYSNLEFDVEEKKRGKRYKIVENLVCEISGAESAFVVNNNAGAVLLVLDTLAKGKEVIVSRGELVEIGGSFRIPDIMKKSGSKLVEIGTTNRTHLKDYENAISDDTAIFLKVHQSNYSIVGFTKDVILENIVALGKKYKIPVIEDLGSGTFIDFSKYGLKKEPTIQESFKAGADVITFSGDKLLGGPQAGIIVGKKKYIDAIKSNPLSRALRIDKLTLAALEATLRFYYDEKKAISKIPTLRMITLPLKEINKKANRFINFLKKLNNDKLKFKKLNLKSYVGGGSLPTLKIETVCVALKIDDMSSDMLDKKMRSSEAPVIGRIENDFFIIDFRCVEKSEIDIIANYVKNFL